jgi:hypothetical protein
MWDKLTKQFGDVTVSLANSLRLDHAALTFKIFPLDSITIIPPPALSGFKATNKLKDSWMKEFVMLLPPGLPYTPEHSTVPPDSTGTLSGHESLDKSLNLFNWAINKASHCTLKPN